MSVGEITGSKSGAERLTNKREDIVNRRRRLLVWFWCSMVGGFIIMALAAFMGWQQTQNDVVEKRYWEEYNKGAAEGFQVDMEVMRHSAQVRYTY